MNLNQTNPEIQGNPSVEMPPVEAQPLQMPAEDQSQQVENPETTGQITPPEQIQTTPPITEVAQSTQQPVSSDAEKTYRLSKVVHGDVNSLSDASRLVDETSFKD